MKLLSAIIVAAVATAAAVSARTQTPPQPVPATPENAASFLGEWTITASSSSYGQTTVALTLKAADGKIAGEVADANGTHPLSDISKSGNSLVAYYVFDYQGTSVDTVVTLTPADDKVSAYLDFANGAAQFVGTATKKP